MSEVVTCYSGVRYAERPVAFQYAGERLQVSAVMRTWREPAALFFLVQSADGRRFRLAYEEETGRWSVDQLTDAETSE
jgi:hypothetical protein